MLWYVLESAQHYHVLLLRNAKNEFLGGGVPLSQIFHTEFVLRCHKISDPPPPCNALRNKLTAP